MKHTPGPWHAYKYPDTKSWTVASEESIASKIKTRDDATLIAAAPDMLSVLNAIIVEAEREAADIGQSNRPGDQSTKSTFLFIANSARQAIEKARGER